MITSFPQPEFKLLVSDDARALAQEAARRFAVAAGRSVDAGAYFRVALAGGRTPLDTYRALCTEPYVYSVHWGSVQFFWGDERFVLPDHPDSNYRAAREALLDRLPTPPAGVFPVPCEADSVEAAAAAYQRTLAEAFDLGPGGAPRFDLVLLGLGEDGHTASLFPGALPAGDPGTLVAGVRAEGVAPFRVSLTPAALNAAREVIFLVSGARKADILERVLRARDPDPALPATLVRPVKGKVTWMVDRAAAARIVEGADGNGGGKDADGNGGGTI
jgi:6-phosphogluconolactonase